MITSTPPSLRVAVQTKGSLRARIARGSGVTVSEVNQLMERFAQAQKMMKRMASGQGVPGMPGGIPGMGGAGGVKKNRKNVKGKNAKKGRSGNPAKREAELKGQVRKPAQKNGSSFGKSQDFDMDSMNLPKGFEKFLGDK